MKSFISQRAQNFETSGIRKIFDMTASLENPINLSIGQPDFGPSGKVKQQTIGAVKMGYSKYTESAGILPLRQKVAQKYANANNIKVTPDQVVITSGTSAAIFLTLSVTLDPGDEVIIPDPYFVEYPELVKFLGAKPIFLDTYPTFQPDPQKLEQLITPKTKMIIINTPNNPTGAVYPKQTLQKIAQIAKKHQLLILSDEIYEKFIYDNKTHFSIGSIYSNTITVDGPAKFGGIPGWRLGWLVGPQAIIDKIKELQQYTFVNAPSLVQYGILPLFDESFKKASEYQQKRDLIYNLLSQKFEIQKPAGAFYLMVNVGYCQKFTKWAIKNNVLVIPGNAFSQKSSHIRISYATSNEKIEVGAKILLNYPI